MLDLGYSAMEEVSIFDIFHTKFLLTFYSQLITK